MLLSLNLESTCYFILYEDFFFSVNIISFFLNTDLITNKSDFVKVYFLNGKNIYFWIYNMLLLCCYMCSYYV